VRDPGRVWVLAAAALTSAATSAAVVALVRLTAGAPAGSADTADIAPTVGSATNELVVAQLAAEQARKGSLEARGITVITSSGTLVTLLLALGAVSAKVESLQLSRPTFSVVLAALTCFVVAAVAGILCNFPRGYAGVQTYTDPDDKDFAEGSGELAGRVPGMDYYLVEKNYRLPVREVDRRFAVYRVAELDVARIANNFKARALTVGIIAEVLAIVLVSAGVGLILYGRLA
jgi:hypothetical protein